MLYVTEATGHWIMAAYFVVVVILAALGLKEG